MVLTYCEKNSYRDREFFLKFDTEGREFAKILRSLQQFAQTVHCSERSEQFSLPNLLCNGTLFLLKYVV